MAVRVTVEEVKEIIEIDSTVIDDDVLASAFINLANIMVTANLVTGCTNDLSTDELKEIERWLTAHFVCMKDRRVSSEGAGPVNASYINPSGMNLQASLYGQNVMMIDRTGTFAAMNQGKRQNYSILTIDPESTSGVNREEVE